jgi:hypothetical protein
MPIRPMENQMRRGRSTAGTVLSLAAILACAPAAEAAVSTEHGVNRKKLAKTAEQVTEERNGIEVIKISRCSPVKRNGRPNYGKWTCFWRAEGLYPGEVPYHCSGTSRWKRKAKSWRVDGCANILQPQAPLLPVPNPDPVFGFNDNWIFLGDDAMDASQAAGAQIARTSIPWSGVEPSPGRMNWFGSDELYRRLQERGMQPLWVLIGAPCWAQPNPGDCTAGDDQIRPAADRYEQLAAFAVKVAQRYPESYAIEIWNEPNYPKFWGGPPEPERYADMLKTVGGALEREAPEMAVVSGGLSPHSDNETSGAIGYRNFMIEMYERGAFQYADAIGIHPYPGVGPGEDYIADVRIQFGKIQNVMQRYGDSARPLWATEFGVSTSGPHAFAPAHQGSALIELYQLMRRIQKIDLAVVHRFIEDPNLGGREGGFGVLNPDLTPKPAYCSLGSVRGQTLSC